MKNMILTGMLLLGMSLTITGCAAGQAEVGEDAKNTEEHENIREETEQDYRVSYEWTRKVLKTCFDHSLLPDRFDECAQHLR